MIILGIETSCDETAISIIKTEGKIGGDFNIKILANEILSQIDIHKKYGGVFPMIAKREHGRNLVPLLKKALAEAGFGNSKSQITNPKQIQDSKSSKKEKTNSSLPSTSYQLQAIFEREPELWEQFEKEIPKIKRPPIDAVAVTRGPGLEPALWTGINLAKALSAVWDIPLIPINHMEGHVFASLLSANTADQRRTNADLRRKEMPDSDQTFQLTNLSTYKLATPTFPAVALLVSGGHTELILMKNWFEYEILGATRDDAVGEAFDKVARILGLPYPGGPQISALAEIARTDAERTQTDAEKIKLPRPMINSGNLDFSFSGIKTSVLYFVKKLPELTDKLKSKIAMEFEDAVVEVLTEKTRKAILQTSAKTLIVGGGVASNKLLREKLAEMAKSEQVEIFISEISHSTDNALMIAVAGATRYQKFGIENQNKEFGAEGGYRVDKIK